MESVVSRTAFEASAELLDVDSCISALLLRFYFCALVAPLSVVASAFACFEDDDTVPDEMTATQFLRCAKIISVSQA